MCTFEIILCPWREASQLYGCANDKNDRSDFSWVRAWGRSAFYMETEFVTCPWCVMSSLVFERELVQIYTRRSPARKLCPLMISNTHFPHVLVIAYRDMFPFQCYSVPQEAHLLPAV